MTVCAVPTARDPHQAFKAATSLGFSGHDTLVVDDRLASDPARSLPGCQVLDRRARAALADQVAGRASVPRRIARDLLLGMDGRITTGSARNTALLRAPRGHLCFLDDDVEGPVRAAPSWREPLHFGGPPHESIALDDPSGVDSVRLDDVLDAWLGLEVGRGLPTTPEALAALGGRTVRLVIFGLRGDVGSESQRWRLLFEDARMLTATSLVRAAARPRIDVAGRVVAACLGVDTSSLVPPFPPEGRNQDAAFGMMTMWGCPKAALAFAPVTVAHRPGDPRPIRLHRHPWLLADALQRLLVVARPRPSVTGLARALHEVGPAASDLLREARDQDLGALVGVLEGLPATPPREEALAALRALRTDARRWIPTDLVVTDTPERALRDWLARMAALLASWPALWEAADDLRAAGWPP